MNLKSDFLALLGLFAFAIAHPVLDALGHGATFFVAHGAEVLDILTFALVIYILPAILVIATARCLKVFSNAAANMFISLVIGVLAGFWAMIIVSALPATFSIAIALAFGAIMGICYFSFSRLRDFMRVFGLLSPLVVVFFLIFTPVKSLIFIDTDFEVGPLAGSKTPIVMMLFDELSLAAITTPDGEIDAGRLPNFSRLERISTWYRNTTTASTQTEKAVPAILSGIRPSEKTQPVYSEFPRNLFTRFAASHKISAMETITRLCPETVCTKDGAVARNEFDAVSMYRDVWFVWLHLIFPADLAEKYLPSISNRWGHFIREDDSASEESSLDIIGRFAFDMTRNQVLRFSEFISSIQKNTGATVNYFHLALPHTPWLFLPDGTAYNGSFIPGRTEATYGWIDDQYLVDKGVLRYSLQVEYADFLLGQALDALEQKGRLFEIMLIVVSDHGVAYAPGKPGRSPTASTLAEVSRVPLFIKYPGHGLGVRDDRKIETIDILPTVMDVLGLPLTGDMDGQSLIADDWQPVERHVLEVGNKFPNFERDMDKNMRTASERIYRVLKPGRTALDSIGFGSGKQYVGKPVPIAAGTDKRYALQLINSKWYEEVDLDSGFLPARMTGTLNGARLGTEIMVALNGTVAGSGMTYDESGSVAIMLDPRRFRNGKNDIRAYLIGVHDILEIDIALDIEGWSIRRDDTGIVMVMDKQGSSYQQDDSLKGRANFNVFNGSLAGYACDETRRLAPKTMLLVEDDTIITTGFTMTNDRSFSKGEGIPELECWFSLEPKAYQRRRGIKPTVLALFEGGRMVEIHPK